MRMRSPMSHPMSLVNLRPTLTKLKTIPTGDHQRGEVIQLSDGRQFYFARDSVETADDIFIVKPNDVTPVASGSVAIPAVGRFYLAEGAVDLSLPIGFGTADAAILATLPTGFSLLVQRGYWEVTTAFTGGTSSAIGLSSSGTGYTTKGDLLGGASGDVLASLTVGTRPGTVGADIAAGVILNAGDTIRFDRVTSAFTAGAGFAHLVGVLLKSPGAGLPEIDV